jgi:twitching motility protein PilT
MRSDFTDLILCASGEAFLKGVSGGSGLSLLGPEFAGELQALREALDAEEARDWTLLIDGVQFRVASRESVAGREHFLRRAMRAVPSLAALGMRQDVARKLLSPDFRHGLVVICGRMSSGKTTTACAAIADRLETMGGHAVTVEDPPELPLHGTYGERGYCFQFSAGKRSFSEVLVEQLRNAAPEIILLGELRRPEDAAEALRASVNGHLVFVTLHAADVADALLRLDALSSQVCGEMSRMLMAEGVKLVLRQRLDGQPPRRVLAVQSLEVDSTAVQATIREGRFKHLADEIASQAHAALHGRGGVGR